MITSCLPPLLCQASSIFFKLTSPNPHTYITHTTCPLSHHTTPHALVWNRRAQLLRSMLRRRDHELSKLVMRLVSLQELINQGGHLSPTISRYSRFEGATVTTAHATYM